MSDLPNYYWIKFRKDALDDHIFMGLSDSTVGIYLKLYILAAISDAGGLLCDGDKSFSLSDIGWRLRIDLDILSQAIEELNTAGFISVIDERYSITRFLKEQGPGNDAQREVWRKRQSKHRAKHEDSESEKEKDLEKDVDVDSESDIDIESHGDVTQCHGDRPTLSPLRGEKNPTTASSFSNEAMKSLFHMLDQPINKTSEDALLLSLKNRGIPANSKDEALEWAHANGYC
jgi:hypothetical protein